MTGRPRSTRRLALLAVALSALLVTAGCLGSVGNLGANDTSAEPQLDSIPASAEYVSYVDAAGMADDESLRSIANTAMEASGEYDDGPTDVDGVFDQAENDSDLDPSKFDTMTAFGTAPENPMEGEGSAAAVLATSYTEDEVVAAIEKQDGELTEETYGDTTLYAYESDEDDVSVLAVLGDGTFAAGDRSAVESVIDVRNGDADALNGDLKATFEDTEDGYVRFAMAMPSEADVPSGEQSVVGNQMDVSALGNVTHVSGSFATSDGNVTTTMSLVAASEGDATEVYNAFDGVLSLYASMGEEDSATQSVLDAVSVSQDGETVTVTHTDTVENVESQVEAFYDTEQTGYGSGSNSTSASVATIPAGE
ncbi:hypothetical protein [Halobacterium jilantaiense]|uniref:Uncharacterized protein n=1 Tax=Halobacterium jilantaiense TaxID=355548 RepID=A0A1I0MIS0_9EURY|nr:hypothetical protein [Halobacterium jilantaiense]SEV87934.1 hypothetical protein SAMN04487945_0083 [Halobacterium jilantaiense]